MKPINMIYLGMVFIIFSCSQEIPSSKVPSIVLNKAQAIFPGVRDMDWEKEKNHYEAEFKIDSIEHSLDIDGRGNVLLHKWDIKSTELPGQIQQAVQLQYPGYAIEESNVIEKNGQRYYELELETKGKKDLTIKYNSTGELIKNI